MTNRLLTALEAHANVRGVVLANEATLADTAECRVDELRTELAALESAGEVEVLTPPPFLVLRLQKWSGKRVTPSIMPRKSGAPGHSYSYHNQSIDKSKAIAGSDGGSGEGEDLLSEILATLGESNPVSFRGVLQHFSPATIHAALRRVRATPPERLRKSRTALFRYLLARFK